MTTLISYQSAGGDQGRCDAKCYNALRAGVLTASASGHNHGVGKEQAIENTRELG